MHLIKSTNIAICLPRLQTPVIWPLVAAQWERVSGEKLAGKESALVASPITHMLHRTPGRSCFVSRHRAFSCLYQPSKSALPVSHLGTRHVPWHACGFVFPALVTDYMLDFLAWISFVTLWQLNGSRGEWMQRKRDTFVFNCLYLNLPVFPLVQ